MNAKKNPWVSLAALVLLVCLLATVCTNCTNTTEATGTATPDRFTIEDQSTQYSEIFIITDNETGVQYLWVKRGYGAGLTMLQPGTTETEE